MIDKPFLALNPLQNNSGADDDNFSADGVDLGMVGRGARGGRRTTAGQGYA